MSLTIGFNGKICFADYIHHNNDVSSGTVNDCSPQKENHHVISSEIAIMKDLKTPADSPDIGSEIAIMKALKKF